MRDLFCTQAISSLQKLEALSKLHTVQMEGNPVWSVVEYTYHLVTSLPGLSVLDQQEISPEVRTNAERWKEAQVRGLVLQVVSVPI